MSVARTTRSARAARTARSGIEAVLTRLAEPMPADGLVVWRVALGLLLASNVVRYALAGWVDALFVAPHVMFPHWGFGWVPRPDALGTWALFAIVFVGALGIAHGRRLRTSALVTFVAFTWLEVLDRSTYLNHYYLVSLVLGLLVVLPLGATSAPRLTWLTLRAQVGLVYVFAGIAKWRSDWLFEAEPLATWLGRYADLPWLGPVLGERATAFVASWAGMLFDVAVVGFLAMRRTRPYAFAAVVVFHVATAALFSLGLFPWLMIANATLFFEPDWPRRLRAKLRGTKEPPPTDTTPHDTTLHDATPNDATPNDATPHHHATPNDATPHHHATPTDATAHRHATPNDAAPRRTALVSLLAVHFALQLALPFRQHLYPGDPLWHEQGFRFSWCVMLVEKTATLDLRVVDAEGRETIVHPREELTPLQLRMVPTQPDLVLAYAHHVRDRFERDGHGPVQVFADGWASLNARPRRRLVHPNVDLANEEDGLRDKPWIVRSRD